MKVAVPNLLLTTIATETIICAQGNDGVHVWALLEEKYLPYADYMDSLSFSYAGIPNSDQSPVKSSKSSKSSKECFKASMAPFTNGGVFLDYPAIKGQVKICFDKTLELNSSYPTTTAGVLTMSVTGLINGTKAPSPGGVHIHRGANCTSIGSQQGHFFNNCSGSANPTGRKQDCDPWYNNVDHYIAPTGTKYAVDKRGKGKADVKFDHGYGDTETAGKVVVMHLGINATDYSATRIACGELVAASD